MCVSKLLPVCMGLLISSGGIWGGFSGFTAESAGLIGFCSSRKFGTALVEDGIGWGFSAGGAGGTGLVVFCSLPGFTVVFEGENISSILLPPSSISYSRFVGASSTRFFSFPMWAFA